MEHHIGYHPQFCTDTYSGSARPMRVGVCYQRLDIIHVSNLIVWLPGIYGSKETSLRM